MKILYFLAILPLALGIDVDCSMSDSTRCDCIHAVSPSTAPVTLAGTDCRVCRINNAMYCVLWGSSGTRYGPLCDPSTCSSGKTWRGGIAGGPGGSCYCDWGVKEHDRAPCPTPAGDCKCSHNVINGTATSTATLPGKTCTVCPASSDGPYVCTETGNKKNGFGPLCTGSELGPDCTGRNCVCNWMMSMSGDGWRNVTKEENAEVGEMGVDVEQES